MKTILIVAISQVFVALYLLRSNRSLFKQDYFIKNFILLALIHFSLKFLLLELADTDFLFRNLITSLSLAYGPLLYFAICKYYRINYDKTKVKHHFTPPLVASVFYVVIVGNLFTSSNNYVQWLSIYRPLMVYAFLISITVYGLLSVFTIRKHQSSDDSVNSNRLKIISYLLFIPSIIVWALSFIFPNYFSDYANRVIIYGALTIICILLIQHLFYLKMISFKRIKKKYEKSEIKGVDIEEIAINLEKYVSENKVYLDENITLDKLADNLGVPKHHLTQVLNIHLNKNFYKFINHYRIEEAKQIMERKKNDSMNLLDIGFQCGFKSKASFNRYFKMETNLTPSEYRKQLKDDSSCLMDSVYG